MTEEPSQLARAIIDAVRRMAVHYGLWFANTADMLGLDRALALEREAGDRATAILLERLATVLGDEVRDGLPAALVDLPAERQQALLTALAVNWLVLDGVWFQALEQGEGMDVAKQVNDACWARFSPLEAARIKAMAGLPEAGGLETLARAFADRLYGVINEQEVFFEADGALVMRMTQCRVQNARKRKGLADYPCKSGGVVEYTTFARTVDPRIRCECIACPPDPHPDGWFCAWRFRLA
ncbi:MAG: hypothetical protein RLZZ501_2271 [Pseudomonadota bacterium]